MNYTDRKTAYAVVGKTARACDSCLRKRARWYCAADDAFLCQGCDSLVHSANQLASRHERVRLGTASNKPSESKTLDNDSVPAWHQGFTRKARTPRHSKPAQKGKERSTNVCVSPLVPDLGTEDALFEETEAQLLYRVPVLDSFAVELCNVSNESENIHTDYINEPIIRNDDESTVLFSDSGNDDLDNLPVFLPSDMEFAADVESLLGTGLDEESCGIEGLGLIDCKEENDIDDCYEGSKVKIEDDEEVQAIIACHFDLGLDLSRETLDWNFDYESPVTGEEQEEEKAVVVEAKAELMNGESREMRKKKFLRLNYEEVIVAWDNQGCPWTSGIRPEFNPDDCWPDFMGMNAPGAYHPYGGAGGRMGSGSDGGREARVSRYREKRRTRLFSKKIRYEVRKLNAEKRPRMKGRFVKRTSFAGGSTNIPTYLMNK